MELGNLIRKLTRKIKKPSLNLASSLSGVVSNLSLEKQLLYYGKVGDERNSYKVAQEITWKTMY